MSVVAGLALLANQAEMGGGEVMLLAMAAIAMAGGIDVTVVGPPGETLDAARSAGLRVQAVPGGSRATYLASLTAWTPAPDQLTWCVGLLPSVATSGRPNRVVHLHQEPQSPAQRSLARSARVRANATYVPSRALAAAVPGSRILWNWTDDLAQLPTPAPAGTFRVGFSGRINTDKGFDVLCRAVAELDRRDPGSVELVVAGDDRFVAAEQRAAIEVAQRPVAHLTRRLGWVPREQFLEQVDVVAMPSTWLEAFGLVAAETMAAGIPLVVSDAGALPEVVGREHPWVVRRGSTRELVHALETVRDRTDDAGVVAARDRWEQHFSPEAGRRRFTHVLQSLGLSPRGLPAGSVPA